MMLEFGLSVGIGKAAGEESNSVLITIANAGSSTFSPAVARMIAAQLWMSADLLDKQEGEDDQRDA